MARRGPEYRAWVNMKRWGPVCERWRQDFGAFVADLGPRPGSDHLLSWLDKSKPYGPGNAAWTTHKQSQRNKRGNRRIEYQGQIKTMVEWAEVFNLPYHLVCRRLGEGWTVDQALGTPRLRPGQFKDAESQARSQPRAQPRSDLTGARFGELRVLCSERPTGKRRSLWRCQCSCGALVVVRKESLPTRRGTCVHRIAQLAQLKREHPKEYSLWIRMAARGPVCARWKQFDLFFSDIGARPAQTLFVRLDESRPFAPANTAFIRPDQDKRLVKWCDQEGKRKSLRELAASVGLKASTVWNRLKLGWSLSRALGTPTETSGLKRGLRDTEEILSRRRDGSG